MQPAARRFLFHDGDHIHIPYAFRVDVSSMGQAVSEEKTPPQARQRHIPEADKDKVA